MVDPYNCDYNLIRNQSHIVDLPENVEDILHYNGQIQVILFEIDCAIFYTNLHFT